MSGGSWILPVVPWRREIAGDSADTTVPQSSEVARARGGQLAKLMFNGSQACNCPHSHAACNEKFEMVQKLVFHLVDVHRWVSRKTKDTAPPLTAEDTVVAAGLKCSSLESDAPTKLC